VSAPVDLSGLLRFGERFELNEPGDRRNVQWFGCDVDGEYVKLYDVRALLAAAPAPAAPTASADTKDFERLANKWFSSRFISTAELGKAWAEMAAHIDAHTARAVAAKQAEIDHLKFELHEATNSIVARMAAPQQHAQAALGDEQVVALREIASSWMAESGRDALEDWIDTQRASHQPAAAPAQPVADLIVHMNSVEAKIRPEYSTFDALKVGTYPVYLAAQPEVKP
jgi:hypothetical protein